MDVFGPKVFREIPNIQFWRDTENTEYGKKHVLSFAKAQNLENFAFRRALFLRDAAIVNFKKH